MKRPNILDWGVLILGIFIGLAGGFGVFYKPEVEIANTFSPDDYCRSVGYDFAAERDIDKQYAKPYGVVYTPRVKCAYHRNGPDGKSYRGFSWYQYPPKTDLENYCDGDLKKSATVIIPN